MGIIAVPIDTPLKNDIKNELDQGIKEVESKLEHYRFIASYMKSIEYQREEKLSRMMSELADLNQRKMYLEYLNNTSQEKTDNQT